MAASSRPMQVKWTLGQLMRRRWSRTLLLSVLVGLLSGLAARALQSLIELGFPALIGRVVNPATIPNLQLRWGVLLLPALGETWRVLREPLPAGAPRQLMNEWTTKPEEILETFAAEMRANLRHYSIHPGNYALIIPKQLREHLQAGGWTKSDIAGFIHERARIHRREWAEVGKGAVVRDRGDSVYPAMESADQLLVVAAGGPAGGFGAVIPPWLGNKSHAVTLPIGVCVDCEPPKK